MVREGSHREKLLAGVAREGAGHVDHISDEEDIEQKIRIAIVHDCLLCGRTAVQKDGHSHVSRRALDRLYTRNRQAGVNAGAGPNNSDLTAIDSIHDSYERVHDARRLGRLGLREAASFNIGAGSH